MTPIPIVPGDDPFAPLDELLARSLISPEEHRQQCALLAGEMANNIVIQKRRERRHAVLTGGMANNADATQCSNPLSKTNRVPQEPAVNPKTLLDSIELTRTLMTEQYRALDAQVPAPSQPIPRNTNVAATTSDLLNAVVNGQIENALQTLTTLAAVTARVRGQWGQSHGVTPPAATNPEAIDAEYVEIRDGVVVKEATVVEDETIVKGASTSKDVATGKDGPL